MPTTKPRHTITETGRVADALARARSAGCDDIRELVILGSDAVVARAEEERRREDRRTEMKRRLIALAEGPDRLLDRDAAAAAREEVWDRL